MSEIPPTRASLLVRLRDARDAEAWRQFAGLYGPLIYRFGRRHHLQDADAADLTQDVLQSVSTAVGRLEYDPGRGSFRGWLFTLVHRRLADLLARQQRQGRASGDSEVHSLLQNLPAEEEDHWNREYERRLFAWAAGKARREFALSTWRAFWQTAVRGQGAQEVGKALGMSVGAVYVARSRVQARLRQLIAELRGD
jgi:RNA polymerase sigma-70 factor (ECF subfamily)